MSSSTESSEIEGQFKSITRTVAAMRSSPQVSPQLLGTVTGAEPGEDSGKQEQEQEQGRAENKLPAGMQPIAGVIDSMVGQANLVVGSGKQELKERRAENDDGKRFTAGLMNRVSGQVNPVGPYTEDETQQVSGPLPGNDPNEQVE